jgi:hypothetical protein
MATWKQDIINAIAELGGQAKLDDIYEKVKRTRKAFIRFGSICQPRRFVLFS